MKITELHLLSDNLLETENFYNTVLEIKTATKNDNEITFIIGTTKLCFLKSKNVEPVYHLAFDIANNRFTEALEWTKSKVKLLPVDGGDKVISNYDTWNAKSFYFYDNNGNLLELIARFDIDIPFNSSAILYASEIGIVSDNVPETAALITSKYNVGEFTKQTGTPEFTALGDDYGLFVLVNNKRNWFPTKNLAKSFPTKIVFDTDVQKGLVYIF